MSHEEAKKIAQTVVRGETLDNLMDAIESLCERVAALEAPPTIEMTPRPPPTLEDFDNALRAVAKRFKGMR